MGLHDRPYMSEPSGGRFRLQFGGLGGRQPMKAVTLLLLINIGVYILQALTDDIKPNKHGAISANFAAMLAAWWQVWRYLTFQFLHVKTGHIFWNMLGLFFLGRAVEQVWGRKRFLLFYLTSGALAGIVYVIIAKVIGLDPGSTLRGASGGVYAVLLACVVLFWGRKVLLFFMLPTPMWVVALIWFVPSGATLIGSIVEQTFGGRFWSEVAHMGGVVGGAFWIWVLPLLGMRMASARVRVQRGAWDRKVKHEAEEEKTIDEILRKIHNEGINSLSGKEKKTLAAATKRQRGE